jgi:MFS transporter, putative metabolite:H+ symporter
MNFKKGIYHITLLTSALAYLSNAFAVNIPYVVSESPLIELHILPNLLLTTHIKVLFFQHVGLFVGALFFSLFVDKKGRLFILFLSIFIYSLGTFFSGLVTDINTFYFLKFIVGFGLAPELGIGIVLVSEIYSPSKRSLVVAIIGCFGFLSAVALGFLIKMVDWRDLYMGVGLGGLLIMLLRFSTFESDLFLKMKNEKYKINSLKETIFNPAFSYLLLAILPKYVLTAISAFTIIELFKNYGLVANTSSITKWFGSGVLLGIIIIPIFSKILASRKIVIQICLVFLFILSVVLISTSIFKPKALINLTFFYTAIGLLGFFSGYMFELFILAVEQFGTNRRASSTMLLFSFGRTSVMVFTFIIPIVDTHIFNNYTYTSFSLEILSFFLAFWAISNLKENYNRDLDFVD